MNNTAKTLGIALHMEKALHYQRLRDQLNNIHQKLQNAPPEFKQGYWCNNVGSILNAYREADISFDEACKLLTIRADNDD